MKTLKMLVLLVAGMGLIMSCETYPKPDVKTGDPFNASFTVSNAQQSNLRIAVLAPDNNGHLLTGTGAEAGLGEFAVQMQLCNGAANANDPICGYYYASGVITTANGEELHFYVPQGQIPALTGDQHQAGDASYDRFMFVGGTGRFVSANGNASISGRLLGYEKPWQLEFTVRGKLNTSAPF